ncbi:hypothetical protein [Streptomyces sp. NPDC093094]|uniref:hypothetical protein n=1 Tax=Streptomyces sp. NPDC093094 TaxID=3366026 RepID=UPI0037FBA81D
MHDEQNSHGPALTELRRRLADGLARARLNQTQLARRAGLGRTTVSEALSPSKPVPSKETVAALARALRLPVAGLLELQRRAAAEPGTAVPGGPGRPIGQWEPHDLEVHPAGPGPAVPGAGTAAVRALPGYVRRVHDRVLAEAVEDAAGGRSRIVVLVGTSSTGKTRACWEAVQPLAKRGWRLWHPYHPARVEAALEDLQHVGPRTVVWLNEAQHYLGDRTAGERIAAAVHHLLISPKRGPVLVLGTLWPEYAKEYTALPTPRAEDPHSRARELLASRTLTIPDAFDTRALAAATALAEGGDRLLADALTRARVDGRITQDLAGAPELLNRYQHAIPAAKALLDAAMDARRLGVGLHLPQAFLTDAAPGYLTDLDHDQLTDDWAEQAYAELAEPVHGRHPLLRRTTPRPSQHPPAPTAGVAEPSPRSAGPLFRLADYLDQHGRTARRHLCPPASFWHAAHTHLTHPDDLDNLTREAEQRHRLQWAHHLRRRAADHGSTSALNRLAELRERTGDWEGAEKLARQAAHHGDTVPVHRLAAGREEAGDRKGAEELARLAAEHGDTSVLKDLAMTRERAGDQEAAEALLLQAARHGNTSALHHVAVIRERAGDRENADKLARLAAEHGDTSVLKDLAVMRERAGDQQGSEALLLQAARHGNTSALHHLAGLREEAGDRASADALACQAADHGDNLPLYRLAVTREEAGDRERAEALARQAAEHGSTDALNRLTELREEAGDREGAETLARQAAEHGSTRALYRLTMTREKAGDRKGAEALARLAAEHGSTRALNRLTMTREKAGDRKGAEKLAREAAHHGDTSALHHLAMRREEAGDREGAEALARLAAKFGSTRALYHLAVTREEAGDRQGSETLLRQAARHGSTSALYRLAVTREEAGDRKGAEELAREAAHHGDTSALHHLAMRRERAGDRSGTETLLRQAADHGSPHALYHRPEMRDVLERLWPNGLDPDGTPTPPWQP